MSDTPATPSLVALRQLFFEPSLARTSDEQPKLSCPRVVCRAVFFPPALRCPCTEASATQGPDVFVLICLVRTVRWALTKRALCTIAIFVLDYGERDPKRQRPSAPELCSFDAHALGFYGELGFGSDRGLGIRQSLR